MKFNLYKLHFFPAVLLCFLLSCSSHKENTEADAAAPSTQGSSDASEVFSFEILNNSDGTFGYAISKNGKQQIVQPNIPGRSGHSGFASESQARKTAEIVIKKLEKGIFPPTLRKEEIDSILND